MNKKVAFSGWALLLLIPLIPITSEGKPSSGRTVGLIFNNENSSEGYTLFSPMTNTTTYLIDNQGLKVNSWESQYTSGQAAYLTEDGYLYRTINLVPNNVFELNTQDGIEKLDWDGNVVWHYEYSGDNYQHHHDFEILPNGNVLMLAVENMDTSAAIEAGRNPETISRTGLQPDLLYEIKPIGDSGGVIVWEWHAWDHLIQDYDSTKENYGMVSEQPAKVDINFFMQPFTTDWIHINSVDYNEEFDQILLSCRDYSEVWVIDHSTTMQESADSIGGKYGKGGDILYRWGNPKAYDRGEGEDRHLYQQHDAQWILPHNPGAGNILVFNNGWNRGYSSVDEFTPPVDDEGFYNPSLPYPPDEPIWTWTAPNPWDFFAQYFSSAQRLPNGNTLVCDGPEGIFFEITPEGKEVWRYINPVNTDGPVYQGDSITNNMVFKIRRYSPDFPGFEGKDMTPGDPVELYPEVGLTENEKIDDIVFDVYPNPFRNTVTFDYQLPGEEYVKISVYNSLGRKVITLTDEIKSAGNHEICWEGVDNSGSTASAGAYFCIIHTGRYHSAKRIVKVP